MQLNFWKSLLETENNCTNEKCEKRNREYPRKWHYFIIHSSSLAIIFYFQDLPIFRLGSHHELMIPVSLENKTVNWYLLISTETSVDDDRRLSVSIRLFVLFLMFIGSFMWRLTIKLFSDSFGCRAIINRFKQ